MLKNYSARGCLLFDWHHWEEPSFVESPCDRKREYICQRIIKDQFEKRTEKSIDQETSLVSEISSSTFITATTPENLPSTSTQLNTQTSNNYNNYLNYNVTTIAVAVNFARRSKTQITTKNYSETEEDSDYYDYNVKDLMMESEKSTKASLEWLRMQMKNSPSIFSLDTRKTTSTENPPIFDMKSRKQVKPMKALKLYYAFEGPIVGGFGGTNRRSNSDFGRKYQKYVAVKSKS